MTQDDNEEFIENFRQDMWDLDSDFQGAVLYMFEEFDDDDERIMKIRLADVGCLGTVIDLLIGARIAKQEFAPELDWYDTSELCRKAYSQMTKEATWGDFADCFRRLAEEAVAEKRDDNE